MTSRRDGISGDETDAGKRRRFGVLIKHYRQERLGKDQAQLARLASIANRATISKIERGDPCEPETARKLIQVFDDHLNLTWRELRELAVEFLLDDKLQRSKPDRRIIGVLVPSIGHSFFWAPIVGAIETQASSLHYLVILCQHHNEIERELEAYRFFESFDSLRGVISAPAFGTDSRPVSQVDALDIVVNRLKKRNIPMVFLDRTVHTKAAVPSVGIDNRYAARLAVRRLIDAGHRRIAALMDLAHADPQQERLQGYRDALEAAQPPIPYDPALVKFGWEAPPLYRAQEEEEKGRRGGKANAKALLTLDPPPTAVFCASGFLALAVRDVAEDAGYDVPRDLSIIGFDHLHQFKLTAPKITSVGYDTEAYGRRAFTKLHDLIQNPLDVEAARNEIVEPHQINIVEEGSIASRVGNVRIETY